MGFGSFLKKAFRIAAPVIGTLVAPGIGTALGSTLSGAALSGIGGAIGGGVGGAVGGGGVKGALTGAALGGTGGYIYGSGGLAQAAQNAGLGTVAHTLPAGVSGPVTSGSGLAGILSGGGALAGTKIGSLVGNGLGGKLSTLGTVGNIYSALSGTGAINRAADTQSAYINKAAALQNPFYTSGVSASNRLSSLLGTDGSDPNDILEQLRSSPGYQFRLDEGTKALNRSLAAKGGLLSGNALRRSMELGQGLADQTYADYVDDLYRQTGLGTGAANQIGGYYQDLGNIGANRIIGREDVINKGLAGILSGNGYNYG